MKFLLRSSASGYGFDNIKWDYPKLFDKFHIEEDDRGSAVIEIGTLGELLNLLSNSQHEVIIGELDSYDKKSYGDYDAFIEIYDEWRE